MTQAENTLNKKPEPQGLSDVDQNPGYSDDMPDGVPPPAPDKESSPRSDVDIIKELEVKVEKAEKEARENYDRLLRISAETENFKKRMAREMEEFRKFANESLVKELLTVIDTLERAVSTSDRTEANASCIIEGIELTLKDILKILEKFNVTPIMACQTPFDPAFHQAVMQEATDACPANTVVREIQKGYVLGDRLIRPSMVVVSKAAGNETNTTGNE